MFLQKKVTGKTQYLKKNIFRHCKTYTRPCDGSSRYLLQFNQHRILCIFNVIQIRRKDHNLLHFWINTFQRYRIDCNINHSYRNNVI